jgi:hypothetical protein
MLSGETTNTNFIVFGLTQPGLEPTIYCTQGEHANQYATNAINVIGDYMLLGQNNVSEWSDMSTRGLLFQ